MKSSILLYCLMTILFIHVIVIANGQAIQDRPWQQGVIELKNGDALKGWVSYDFTTETIHFRENRNVYSFKADKASHFMLLDDSTNIKTHFYSFPFHGKGSKIKPLSFYELVYQNGSIAILSRHEYIYKSSNLGSTDRSGVYWSQGNVNTEKVREILYLTNGESGILEYGHRLKDRNSFLIPEYGYGRNYRDPRAPELNNSITRVAGEKYKIKKKVLEVLFGESYQEIMDYADEVKNKGNTLDGIRELIRYFKNISEN